MWKNKRASAKDNIRGVPYLSYRAYRQLQIKLEEAEIEYELELMFHIQERLNTGWVALAKTRSDDSGYWLYSYIVVKK